MEYNENYHGIRYSAKRGEVLEIRAYTEDFNLNCWDGVLNLMSNDCFGRTALFADDCDFYQCSKKWLIKVKPGTPSYMKELAKVRPISEFEAKRHSLGRLWRCALTTKLRGECCSCYLIASSLRKVEGGYAEISSGGIGTAEERKMGLDLGQCLGRSGHEEILKGL